MTDRRVSVVITAYNVGTYVVETVESVLRQTHANREIIVVDDGSTDDTADRLAPYLARIRLVKQDHAGLAAARNHGLRLTSGEFIALLDADDVWAPTKLAVQLEIAGRRPQCGMIVCDGCEFEGATVLKANLLSPDMISLLRAWPNGELAGMMHQSMIDGPQIGCPAQTLIPRGVIARFGPFADGGAQDYDYYLRIAQHYPMAFHSQVLVGWRYRPDSMSGPRAQRPLTWALYRLPVLGAHAARCENESDRRLVAGAIDRLTREIIESCGPTSGIGRPQEGR